MTIAERVAAFGGRVSGREAVELGRYPWLTRQFVETDGARARLQNWHAAGCPEGLFEPNVMAYGSRLFDVSAGLWGRLPAPVAWHASAVAVVAGLDPGLGGFCAYLPRLAPAVHVDEAPRLIVLNLALSTADLEATIAHECAHGWIGPVKPRAGAISTAEYRDVKRLAAEIADSPDDEHRPVLAALAREEQLAHLLAHQWGFRGPAADIARLNRLDAVNYTTKGLRA